MRLIAWLSELFHDRAPIKAKLRQIAAAFRAGLVGFAALSGPKPAVEPVVPADRLTQRPQRIFDAFIVELATATA